MKILSTMKILCAISFGLAIVFHAAVFCSAEDSSPATPSGSEPVTIRMNELPTPPEAIASLIKEGNVVWEFGINKSQSSTRQTRGSQRRGLAAETHYRIAYDFHSRSRWTMEERPARTVILSVRITKVRWKPTHTVWFRQHPERENFWEDRLVQHELDHVRISSDDRFEKRFVQQVRQLRSIRQRVSPGDVVNKPYVDKIVAERVASLFEEVSDLIAIRYQELDRVTDHGRQPLPPDWDPLPPAREP